MLYDVMMGKEPKKHKKHGSKKYNDTIPSSASEWQSSYYGQVGKALGFTPNEINALVSANDTGLSFATIAALIDEHPPVLSSALTGRRTEEETAFLKNVQAAILHYQANVQGTDYMVKQKMLADHKALISGKSFFGFYGGVTLKNPGEPYVGHQQWKEQQAQNELSDALSFAFGTTTGTPNNVYANIANTGKAHWQGQFASALLPKPGELAKLLGIWTP